MSNPTIDKQEAGRRIREFSRRAPQTFELTLVVSHNVPQRLLERVGVQRMRRHLDRCLGVLEARLSCEAQPIPIDNSVFSSLAAIYYTTGDRFDTKRMCVDLEEDGFRLVDIDVYHRGEPVCRRDLSLPNRKCFVCDRPAALCIFEYTHDDEEVARAISSLLVQQT